MCIVKWRTRGESAIFCWLWRSEWAGREAAAVGGEPATARWTTRKDALKRMCSCLSNCIQFSSIYFLTNASKKVIPPNFQRPRLWMTLIKLLVPWRGPVSLRERAISAGRIGPDRVITGWNMWAVVLARRFPAPLLGRSPAGAFGWRAPDGRSRRCRAHHTQTKTAPDGPTRPFAFEHTPCGLL